MSTHKIAKLNALLGSELGYTVYNEPKFKWQFSEELFWPAYKTGKMVEQRTPAGLIVMVSEYRKDRMSAKLKDQWVVTKWIPPDLLSQWETNFPSAPYPGKGYYIHTNASLDPFQQPSQDDTEHFIRCIKEQRSMDSLSRLRDMEDETDKAQKSVDNEIDDAVGDCVPAFVNPNPGKRGGHVSFPSLQKQLVS